MNWRLVPLLLLIALNAYFSFASVSGQPQYWPFALFSLVAAFFTLGSLAIFSEYRKLSPAIAPMPRPLPHVALLKNCFNESPELVENTLLSLKGADYPPGLLSIYLLDDSDDAGTNERLSSFCAANGIRYIHRGARTCFKAGALNNFLANYDGEFFAIFDADERLIDPSFIKDNIGFFSDPSVAVLQTNKSSAYSGLFGHAASAINEIFYNFVNPVSAKGGTGSFLGSAAILRRSLVQKVGGFPESTIEDVALSFNLYLAGMRIVHNPKCYAIGRSVENFPSFIRQHSRYIIGMTSLLPLYFSNISRIRISHQPSFFFQYLGLYFVSLFQIAYFLLLAWMQAGGGVSPSVALAALAYVLQSVLAVCILSKELYRSYSLGLVMYLMNFSISLNRLIALVISPLRKAEFIPSSLARRAGPAVYASVIPSLAFSALFAYLSFPLSLFSLVGIPAALIFATEIFFMAFAKG